MKFIIVGVINTIIGTSVMLIAYNFLHFSYWISTSLNYFIGSIASYLLNKYYTFNKPKKNLKELLKFIINIVICYLLAYSFSIKLIETILDNYQETIVGNISMLSGMVIFVFINYFGQRYWVFKEKNKK